MPFPTDLPPHAPGEISLPDWIVDQMSRLSHLDLLVLCHLSGRTFGRDRRWAATPPARLQAWEQRFSARRVQRTLAALERRGCIRSERLPGGETVYAVAPPPGPRLDTP